LARNSEIQARSAAALEGKSTALQKEAVIGMALAAERDELVQKAEDLQSRLM
jgi:hypothetical protein